MQQLFRTGSIDRVDAEFKKSLSAFSFGSAGLMLPPQQSNRVLRCLVDPTDFASLADQITISGPSIEFLIDNVEMTEAAWSCEASCFANNAQPDFSDLGRLNIKPETIRFVACVTGDLLADAAMNIENWIMQKVSRGFRNTINASIILGDGVGKPLGVMHPTAGVPICEVSPATAPGQFSWADILMLKYEIPLEWQSGSAYFMNQRSFALLQSMSSADGRPLFGPMGTNSPGTGFQFAGSPIYLVSQLPDVAPGSTPVMYGNLRAAYTMVTRKAVTMTTDPYTAGWCTLFKFEARVGGAPTCSNALRLLRIK